jgi:hypothetical protein
MKQILWLFVAVCIGHQSQQYSVDKLRSILYKLHYDDDNQYLEWIRDRYMNHTFNSNWLQRFTTVRNIVQSLTRGPLAGRGFDWLVYT